MNWWNWYIKLVCQFGDLVFFGKLPWSLKQSDAEVTRRLLVEQGVSHLRDGQQRTPGVRFGIWGTVGPIPAADDPTACWCWGWWWWCGGWYKTLLLLVLLSCPMPMPTPVPVVPTADGGVLQPKPRVSPLFPRPLSNPSRYPSHSLYISCYYSYRMITIIRRYENSLFRLSTYIRNNNSLVLVSAVS